MGYKRHIYGGLWIALFGLLPVHLTAEDKPALEFIEFKDEASSHGFLLVLEKNPNSPELVIGGRYGGLYFGDLAKRSVDRLSGEFVPLGPGEDVQDYVFRGLRFLAKHPISIVLRANGIECKDCSLMQQNDFVLEVSSPSPESGKTVSYYNDPSDSKTLAYLFAQKKYTLRNHNYSIVERVLYSPVLKRRIFVERRGFAIGVHDAYSLAQIDGQYGYGLQNLPIKKTEELRIEPPRIRFDLDRGRFLDMTTKTSGVHRAFLVERGQLYDLVLLEKNYEDLIKHGYDEMRLLANDFGMCEHFFLD